MLLSVRQFAFSFYDTYQLLLSLLDAKVQKLKLFFHFEDASSTQLFGFFASHNFEKNMAQSTITVPHQSCKFWPFHPSRLILIRPNHLGFDHGFRPHGLSRRDRRP